MRKNNSQRKQDILFYTQKKHSSDIMLEFLTVLYAGNHYTIAIKIMLTNFARTIVRLMRVDGNIL